MIQLQEKEINIVSGGITNREIMRKSPQSSCLIGTYVFLGGCILGTISMFNLTRPWDNTAFSIAFTVSSISALGFSAGLIGMTCCFKRYKRKLEEAPLL